MARTRLYSTVRRMLRSAHRANAGGRPIDGLLERSRRVRADHLERARRVRADHLERMRPSPASESADVPDTAQRASSPLSGVPPRVVIVGAGASGLTCAWRLKQAGLRAVVYDAAGRVGGRMWTGRDLFPGAPGLITELGGELIDGNHLELLALVRELGLEPLDQCRDASAPHETLFDFQGTRYTEAQLVAEFEPVARAVEAAQSSMYLDGQIVSYLQPSGAEALDRMSLAEWLEGVDMAPALRSLLEVSWIGEYGLDCADQSALNLILMEPSLSEDGELELFGNSDERYRVRGGVDQVATRLAARLRDQVVLDHRLEALRATADGYLLTFRHGSTSIDVPADFVVLTLPFSTLRDVRLDLELPEVKRRAIRELGYGTNAKLIQPFHTRPWRAHDASGLTYTDRPFQCTWDSSQHQPGAPGTLTWFLGGSEGVRLGTGTALEHADRYLKHLDALFPGAAAAAAGEPVRVPWPDLPWARGSYMCFKPGQWTTLAGSLGEPVGRLLFAGDHASYDWWAWMNGAVEAAENSAAQLLRQLGLPKPRRPAAAAHRVSRYGRQARRSRR